MKINLSLTIASILALCSIGSSVITAFINNRYQLKLRELDLKHNNYVKNLELRQQNESMQLNVYYSDKKKVFSDFINAANNYIGNSNYYSAFKNLSSSANTVLLYCNNESRIKLLDFLDYVRSDFRSSASNTENMLEYSQTLTALCLVLREDLESTKPTI